MINEVVLMGRLTRDPELRYTGTGKAVTSVSIAVEDDFKNSKGERETTFIPVVVWNKAAEFVNEHFRKGNMIAIQGRIKSSTYEKDGKKQYKTEVIAAKVSFTGERYIHTNDTADTNNTTDDDFSLIDLDADCPF